MNNRIRFVVIIVLCILTPYFLFLGEGGVVLVCCGIMIPVSFFITRYRARNKWHIVYRCVILLVIYLSLSLLSICPSSKNAFDLSTCSYNMRQIYLAIQAYEKHSSVPITAFCSKKLTSISWRVAVLPFLKSDAQVPDELIRKSFFHCPFQDCGKCSYSAVVGHNTVWGTDSLLKNKCVSQTGMLVEVNGNYNLSFSERRDIEIEQLLDPYFFEKYCLVNHNQSKESFFRKCKCKILMLDGTVWHFFYVPNPETLKHIFDIQSSKNVDLNVQYSTKALEFVPIVHNIVLALIWEINVVICCIMYLVCLSKSCSRQSSSHKK